MHIALSAYTSYYLSDLVAFSFSTLSYSRQCPPSLMTYVCAPHPVLDSQLTEVALLPRLVQEAWEEAPSDLEEDPSVRRLAQEPALEEAAALHRLSVALVAHLSVALVAHLSVALVAHLSVALVAHLSVALVAHLSAALVGPVAIPVEDLEEVEREAGREAEYLRDHALRG
jgi:hypothetical protein